MSSLIVLYIFIFYIFLIRSYSIYSYFKIAFIFIFYVKFSVFSKDVFFSIFLYLCFTF